MAGHHAISVRIGAPYHLGVGVRAATVTRNFHPVVSKGRRYEYWYEQAAWNLQCHGHLRTADVWALCLATPSRWRCFVVPGSVLNGKYTLSVQAARLVGGGHWLGRYEEAWDVIRRVAQVAA